MRGRNAAMDPSDGATGPLPKGILAVVLGAALSACVLVAGSTDGYQAADAGSGGATCGQDATCPGLMLECVSAADCNSDSGSQICCFAPTSATGGSATCSSQPCPAPLGAQLCHSSAECANELCLPQSCTFSGVAITILACGNISICTAQ
jgi:hypothetical protein